MRKILVAFLIAFCGINSLWAQDLSGIRNEAFNPDEIVGRDTRNFIEDYLTARFSIYDDLERQKHNWEKEGIVYKYSTPDVYYEFYDVEASPLYKMIEKGDGFVREVKINHIKKLQEPDAYEAEVKFTDHHKGGEIRYYMTELQLKFCERKICQVDVDRIKPIEE